MSSPSLMQVFPQTCRILQHGSLTADMLVWVHLKHVCPNADQYYWLGIDVTKSRSMLAEEEKRFTEQLKPKQTQKMVVLAFWNDKSVSSVKNIFAVHQHETRRFSANLGLVNQWVDKNNFWEVMVAGQPAKVWLQKGWGVFKSASSAFEQPPLPQKTVTTDQSRLHELCEASRMESERQNELKRKASSSLGEGDFDINRFNAARRVVSTFIEKLVECQQRLKRTKATYDTGFDSLAEVELVVGKAKAYTQLAESTSKAKKDLAEASRIALNIAMSPFVKPNLNEMQSSILEKKAKVFQEADNYASAVKAAIEAEANHILLCQKSKAALDHMEDTKGALKRSKLAVELAQNDFTKLQQGFKLAKQQEDEILASLVED